MGSVAKSDRVLIIAVSVLAGAWLLLWHAPVATTITRSILVAVPVLVWSVLLARAWRKRTVFYPLAGLTVLLTVPLLLPKRPVNEKTIQARYIQALTAYEKTAYVWGGESARGIDCSGLVRMALCDAYAEEAWRTVNPGLLRTAASLWWNDASARYLGSGNDSRTILLNRIPSINAAGISALAPGDMAVLGGTHVMAYLGNGKWIGADPGEHCVTIFQSPNASAWFGMEAQLVRWKNLSE